MDFTPEMLSTIIIVTGIAMDIVGAGLLIRSSNKTLSFILGKMNTYVGKKFESDVDEISKKEKFHSSLGFWLLFGGFIIQAVGYAIPFMPIGPNP